MKKIILVSLLAITFAACTDNDDKKTNVNISVKDDSTNAKVQISDTGISVKTEDGKDANISINKNGVHITTNDGEKANISVDSKGVNVETKDSKTNVKVDSNGNVTTSTTTN